MKRISFQWKIRALSSIFVCFLSCYTNSSKLCEKNEAFESEINKNVGHCERQFDHECTRQAAYKRFPPPYKSDTKATKA